MAVTGARSPRRQNLLQAASRSNASSLKQPIENYGGRQGVVDADWFTEDAERMDELPNGKPIPAPKDVKKNCHPTCTWTCDAPKCQSICKPSCKPPVCATACKKPTLSLCTRKCTDPNCVVVCPPQCSHGTCPECKTVCGKPTCALDCGSGQGYGPLCESTCNEPECEFNCENDKDTCKEPHCKLQCERPPISCGFDNPSELPGANLVSYFGDEVSWQGFAKVPPNHLEAMKVKPVVGVGPVAAVKPWEIKPAPAPGPAPKPGPVPAPAPKKPAPAPAPLPDVPAKPAIGTPLAAGVPLVPAVEELKAK